MRRIVLKLHLWVALASAVFLVLAGVTGCVLVLESEIDRWLNPRLFNVAPRGEPQSLTALIAIVERQFAPQRVSGVRLPPRGDLSYELTLRNGRLVYVDPYDGRVLGSRTRDDMVTVKIHQFHVRLLAGETGSRIVGGSAVTLGVMSLTGLVLWWRDRKFSFRWKGPWTRTNYDLHQTSGAWFFVFLLLFSWTGSVISFGDTLPKLILSVTGAPLPPKPPDSERPPRGARRITPDDVLRVAREALPGAVATVIGIPAGGGPTYRVILKFPEDRTPAGRSRVYVDQFSGKALLVENTRQQRLGVWYLNKNRSLHTGDLWGAPTRVLAAAASFMLVMQVITGLTIWWRSRRR